MNIKNYLKFIIPLIESLIFYGISLFYLNIYLDDDLYFYIYTTFGIIISYFYEIYGAIIAIIGFIIAILKLKNFILNSISLDEAILIFINVSIFLSIGLIKQNTRLNIANLNNSYLLAKEKIATLLSQIHSINMSYKTIMENFFIQLNEPIYLYYELRKQMIYIKDDSEMFAQIFFLLNRYLFIEGGIVYKKDKKNYFSLFRYGVSKMPENITMKNYPDWLEIINQSNEILMPKNIQQDQFIIAIPIVSEFVRKINYILVIEKIRFIMLNQENLNNIIITSYMLKVLFEKRLYAQEMSEFSIFTNILVYKPEVSHKIIKERLTNYKKTNIPFKIGCIDISHQENLEQFCKKIILYIRELDEIFILQNKKLLILFSFSETIDPIIERLRKEMNIQLEELSYEHIDELMALNN